MLKKDGLSSKSPMARMIGNKSTAQMPLEFGMDQAAFSEVDSMVASEINSKAAAVEKSINNFDPLISKTLKKKLEARMRQLDIPHNKILSFSEKFFSETRLTPQAREEFRLLMQELNTLYADQEHKIESLRQVNEDLLNSFRGNVSSHFFVDENLLLRRFFSVTPEEIQVRSSEIGKPLEKVSGCINFSDLTEEVKNVIKTGEVLGRDIRADDDRWYHAMVMPYIRQTDYKINGAVISINEITATKRIQKKLEESNKSLIRINEDLDNFVYTTSRHLINPLSHLEGLIELLKVKIQSGNDDVTNVLEMVQNALVQFKVNISNLDEIGSIETEMLKTPDPINFEDLVEDLKFGMHDLLETSHATITTEFSEKQINFSKKSLRSIFYNLITNSIQFRSPVRNLELYISTYSVPGYIVLMVKDNGLGMSQPKLHTAFEKNNLSTDSHGHGLGLYLIKKIVDSSGGKIEVDSIPGEGTVFRIFLRYDVHIH